MDINFDFSVKGEVTKNDCELLLKNSKIGSDYKTDFKSIIGGQDKGYHQWHQIYDVIYFLNEWKFPRLWLKILLVRGQEDVVFQRNFNILFNSWLNIIKSISTKNIEKTYFNEIEKMRELLIKKSKNNDFRQN